MRYSRKCSSFWVNSLIHSALTPWARVLPSRWAQPMEETPAHNSSIHCMVSDRFSGQTVNIAGGENWARSLKVNFKQRKYLYHLKPQCPELPDSMEAWLGDWAPNIPHLSPYSMHHHRLFKGWASLYWNVSGELSMNLSFLCPSTHPQMKRQC